MLFISPERFQQIAIQLNPKKWAFLVAAITLLLSYIGMQGQLHAHSPILLLWLTTFSLIAGLEALFLFAFIYYFRLLHSRSTQNPRFVRIYRYKEWIEVWLFTLLFSLPILIFIKIIIYSS